MKLSIITINLNNANGLLKTLESVASQTNSDFEHIIIDGGSVDESIEIIRSFTGIPPGVYLPSNLRADEEIKSEIKIKDGSSILSDQNEHLNSIIQDISDPKLLPENSRIIPNTVNDYYLHPAHCSVHINYWISEHDHGIYHAMNKGIHVAKGEFCHFLNSGDWLVAPDSIEKMINALPNCSIFYGNILKQMSGGKIYLDKCGQGKLTMVSLYRGSLNHASAFIKRDLFAKYGNYDESLKIVSDWKWFLIAIGLHDESVKYSDIDVVCFDMYGISNTEKELIQQERRKVLEELLPVNILRDYDHFFTKIDKINRVNRYWLSRLFINCMDKILRKWEDIKQM